MKPSGGTDYHQSMDYSTHSKADLLAEADSRGLVFSTKVKKAEIIAALEPMDETPTTSQLADSEPAVDRHHRTY